MNRFTSKLEFSSNAPEFFENVSMASTSGSMPDSVIAVADLRQHQRIVEVHALFVDVER